MMWTWPTSGRGSSGSISRVRMRISLAASLIVAMTASRLG